MQRRLILMRHAKSSWAEPGLSDHERPLNGRGRRDSPRIAERLRELGWPPDAVWSSTSLRTRQTWALMDPEFEGDIPVTWAKELYHADLDDLRSESLAWPDDVETMLALGHNPGWSHALALLGGDTSGMTTANAALLEGEGATWSEALDRAWRVVRVLRPKEL